MYKWMIAIDELDFYSEAKLVEKIAIEEDQQWLPVKCEFASDNAEAEKVIGTWMLNLMNLDKMVSMDKFYTSVHINLVNEDQPGGPYQLVEQWELVNAWPSMFQSHDEDDPSIPVKVEFSCQNVVNNAF